MNDQNIRIATTTPSLKNKIQAKVEKDSDMVYWYIKFNTPLDADTVSHKTMDVTDTDGYLMSTAIHYDVAKNLIIISPLDSYEQDRFYLLNISKKVKSAGGKRLKKEIHILFKLLGSQISEFHVLKKTAEVPKPRPRPRNYEQKYAKSKVYSFDPGVLSTVPQDKLPAADIKVNILLGLGGLATALAGLGLAYLPLMIAGIAVCILGIAHIVFQLTRPKQHSILVYNRGVRLFNREQFKKAQSCFKLAQALDDDNEMAEYALNKVSFYL